MPKKPKSQLVRRPKRRRVVPSYSSVEIQKQSEDMHDQFNVDPNIDTSKFVVESLLLLADSGRGQDNEGFESIKLQRRCSAPIEDVSKDVIVVEHNYSLNSKSKDNPPADSSNLREDQNEEAKDAELLPCNENRKPQVNDESTILKQIVVLEEFIQENIVKEELVGYKKDALHNPSADLGLLNLPKENSEYHNVGNVNPQSKTDYSSCPNVSTEELAVTSDSLCKFISEFQAELPPLWIALREKDGTLNILRLSPHESKVTQRSISIKTNGLVKFFVHGQELKEDHDLFKQMPALNLRSSKEFSFSVIRMLDHFRSFDICYGVPQKKFQSLWNNIPGSFIDRNVFHEVRFDITCRSENCCMILPYIKKRCQDCSKICRILSRQKVPENAEESAEPRNKLCPLKYLNSAEKDARIKERGKVIKSLKNANKRLQEKLNKLIGTADIQDNENQQDELQASDSE